MELSLLRCLLRCGGATVGVGGACVTLLITLLFVSATYSSYLSHCPGSSAGSGMFFTANDSLGLCASRFCVVLPSTSSLCKRLSSRIVAAGLPPRMVNAHGVADNSRC